MEFRTDRLLLRELVPDDLEPILAMDADPQVMRYIGRGEVKDPRENRAQAIRAIEQRRWEPPFGVWAITVPAGTEFRGWCCLKPLGDTEEIEIGYRLARDAWGRGYATEAARRVLRHAFEGAQLDRVVAITHTENAASAHVLEKIGLRYRHDIDHDRLRVRYFDVDRRRYAGIG